MKKEKGPRIAVITGASSGLGREFVSQISRRKDIDEIWIVARRQGRLEELAAGSEKLLRPLAMDLTEKSAMDLLAHRMEEQAPRIKVLVNAAGMGRIGLTEELSLEEHRRTIELNCRAAVEVTHSILPYMGKGSQIINICSVAAYQPLTGLNTYAASKAFLLSWTKALHQELLTKGIHVTALCPYWVKDTEFIPLAMESGKSAVKRFALASRAKGVVAAALRGSKANLTVVSPGLPAKAARVLGWALPDFLEVPLWDLIRRI